MRTKLRNPNNRSLGIGLVCFFVCFLALATCWTPPNGQPCGTPQIADCTNQCVSIWYTPEYSTYCDSRDGECGLDGDCTVVDVQRMKYTEQCIPVEVNGQCVACWPPSGPFPPGTPSGTCPQAQTSGNQCGYCP